MKSKYNKSIDRLRKQKKYIYRFYLCCVIEYIAALLPHTTLALNIDSNRNDWGYDGTKGAISNSYDKYNSFFFVAVVVHSITINSTRIRNQ